MKYKTINGKIRHAHAPVGAYRGMTYSYTAGQPPFDQHCNGCGYHVCSCPPKPEWEIEDCGEFTAHRKEEDGYMLVVHQEYPEGPCHYRAIPLGNTDVFRLWPCPEGLEQAKKNAKHSADYDRIAKRKAVTGVTVGGVTYQALASASLNKFLSVRR